MVYKNLLILFTVFLLNGQELTAAAKRRGLNKRKKPEVAEVSHFDDTGLGDLNEDDLAIINSANFDLLETRDEYIERLRKMPVPTGIKKTTVNAILDYMKINEEADFYQGLQWFKGFDNTSDIIVLPSNNFYKYMPDYIKELMNDRKKSLKKKRNKVSLIKDLRKISIPPSLNTDTVTAIIDLMELHDEFGDFYQAWLQITGKSNGDLPESDFYVYMPEYIKKLMRKVITV